MPLLFNILALLVATLTAGAYWYGVRESLFWIYPWYDIMLHLLGGLVMGLWGSAVSARLRLRPSTALLIILCIATVGALVWEVFEYVIGLEREVGYAIDTTADIINGVMAGAIVSVLYTLLYKKDSYVE